MDTVKLAPKASRERLVLALQHPAVSKAIALLQAEPGRAWTVAKLAKAVAMSRPVLAKRFVEATGVSPLRFLTNLRMSLAEHLLEHSQAPLSQIGAAVGYESEFAFGKAFRRERGVAPGTFRKSLHFGSRPLCRAA
jgi:transcriptional regulator GlxA family with amidase domain